jgi:hypothetical protein
MNARHFPPLIALGALIASCVIWLPIRQGKTPTFSLPAPILPSAAPIPDKMEWPSQVALFDGAARHSPQNPVTISQTPGASREQAGKFRLSAYIGGNGLWVVTLESETGRYFTIRNGELIPHTTLELRGVEFRSSSRGMPEGIAVFYDRANSNYVDIAACEASANSPAN